MNQHKINNRYEWDFSYKCQSDLLLNRDELFSSYIRYMFSRTNQIFKWGGLPDYIDQKDLEFFLQREGFVGVAEDDKGNINFSWCALGGELDGRYIPKEMLFTNNYIPMTQKKIRGENAVLLLNDSNMTGLLPLAEKYASLLAQADISLEFGSINSRFQFLIKADTDNQKQDAEKFIKEVVKGSKLGVIGGASLMDNFKAEDISGKNKGSIKDLIELKQYLISSWYIDIGLNANFNMKREAINSAESGMNDDILLPFIDDMLEMRRKACEQINSLFNVSWSVELNSSWRDIHAEYHAEQDGMKGNSNDETISD